ncbi:SDR family oxidoreductase [Nocardia yamanashiensis]|uniref:SDR family oxidoreductase n=1 Tax=Nocardia yamanashiensis TaxID=209247 RepID=UPI00082B10EA|nr:SDR family oxidoreductase [Nocardia yamanashiensis]
MSAPIFLTGASGVVGTALREQLEPGSYTVLAHRTRLTGTTSVVAGDITRPKFGLPADVYARLADSIGCVVHAAANTQLNADPAELVRQNCLGTRHAIELANAAQVPLIHVSTAFVDAIDRPENSGVRMHYAESKRAGEQLVTDRARRWSIVRPSIVIGDSRDGRIADYQGLYRLAEMVRDGRLPFVPCPADALVDVIPQDVVGAALAHLANTALVTGTTGVEQVWLTSGAAAPTVREVVRAFAAPHTETAAAVRIPRCVDRDQYERLIRPVFLSALDDRSARRIDNLFTHVAPYVSIVQPFPEPTAVGDYLPATADPLTVLERALRHWAHATGGKPEGILQNA